MGIRVMSTMSVLMIRVLGRVASRTKCEATQTGDKGVMEQRSRALVLHGYYFQ